MRDPRRRALIHGLATFALALGACSDDGGNSTITFTAGPSSLAFAATQVADQPWQVIMPSANGTYSFAALGPTYGIVIVCGDADFATITLLHATTGETTRPNFDCAVVVDQQASLGGTVSGASGQAASVNAASTEVFVSGPGSVTYSIMAPEGEWDVFARRHPSLRETDRMIRKNAVLLAEGSPAVVDFDFDTEGFAPELHSVSFAGAEPDELTYVSSTFRNKPGGSTFTFELGSPRSTDGVYLALPASELRDDDIHIVTATAQEANTFTYRRVRRFFVGAEDFTADLPSLPPPSVIEPETTTPYLRLRGSIPSELDADRFDLVYTQMRGPTSEPTSAMTWSASLTRGYIESANPDAYTLPDLSELPGFTASWGLTPGIPVVWQVTTTSSDAGVAALIANQSAAALDERRDDITERSAQFF